MHLLLQSLVDGLMFGSIYAIAGLAFGLVYRLSRVFHIAFGAIGTFGAFLAAAAAANHGGPDLALAVLAGLATSGVLTLAVWSLVYSPMLSRGADQGATFIASLGLALLIQAIVVLIFGPENRAFAVDELVRRRDVASLEASYLVYLSTALGIATLIGLGFGLRRTRWGHQVSALASNPEQAQLVGIRTGVIAASVWALAGALSAVAFILFGMTSNVVATSGTQITLFAALAVIAGGVGSLRGTYLIGLAIGLVSAVVATKVPGQWSTAVVFGAFILMLIARPSGLNVSWEARK